MNNYISMKDKKERERQHAGEHNDCVDLTPQHSIALAQPFCKAI